MKRFYLSVAALAGACLLSVGSAVAGDLPAGATSLAIARQGATPAELARHQIVVGGGFYYGGAPVYAYRPYAYTYRPYYNYYYRPYVYNYGHPYGYGYFGYPTYGYTSYYRPYAYNYYRPYVYSYGPYVTRYYGGAYRGRPYYCF